MTSASGTASAFTGDLISAAQGSLSTTMKRIDAPGQKQSTESGVQSKTTRKHQPTSDGRTLSSNIPHGDAERPLIHEYGRLANQLLACRKECAALGTENRELKANKKIVDDVSKQLRQSQELHRLAKRKANMLQMTLNKAKADGTSAKSTTVIDSNAQ